MIWIDPAALFPGPVVLAAPHMDDDVLACGGTIARLPRKEHVHVIYATDGMGSPEPVLPWRDAVSPDLGAVRMEEARAALGCLGVPHQNVHFLGLPDSRLQQHQQDLRRALVALIQEIAPAHVLMPFRYDCHADHLALNHAITAAHQQRMFQAELVEYFVYYRWRLLPDGDVRKHIHPQLLLAVDVATVAAQKRAALDCFKSQTTTFYAWQARPNLTAQLLDEVSQSPELFLRYDASLPGASVLRGNVTWMRVAHRLEPALKKGKDQAVALWRRGFYRNGRTAS